MTAAAFSALARLAEPYVATTTYAAQPTALFFAFMHTQTQKQTFTINARPSPATLCGTAKRVTSRSSVSLSFDVGGTYRVVWLNVYTTLRCGVVFILLGTLYVEQCGAHLRQERRRRHRRRHEDCCEHGARRNSYLKSTLSPQFVT